MYESRTRHGLWYNNYLTQKQKCLLLSQNLRLGKNFKPFGDPVDLDYESDGADDFVNDGDKKKNTSYSFFLKSLVDSIFKKNKSEQR